MEFPAMLRLAFCIENTVLVDLPTADRVGPFLTGEFGPRNIKKFGNPAAPIPKYDFGCSTHASWRFTQSRPVIGNLGLNEVSKPVAQMITSSECSWPSYDRQPCLVIALTPVGTILMLSLVRHCVHSQQYCRRRCLFKKRTSR